MIFPEPTLDVLGLPENWQWSVLGTYDPVGYLQVLIDGLDVTIYNGVPTIIESWSSADPFDDELAVLQFPSLSPFVAVPDWLYPGAPVDINLRTPDGEFDSTLFEGFFLSLQDVGSAREWHTEIHCPGANYQLDLFTQMPKRYLREVDIGEAIHDMAADPRRQSLRITPPPITLTGTTTRKTGSASAVLSGAVRELLHFAQADTGTANPTQWTVMKDVPRQMTIKKRDRTTVNVTYRFGTPGVFSELTVDHSMAPNIIYGSGTADDGCFWMNAKYPGLYTDEVAWPGQYLNTGSTGANVLTWKTRMKENGWNVVLNSSYSAADKAITKQMQRQGGLTIDGIVGPQTWEYTFTSTSTTEDDSYYAPIYYREDVEPFLYDSKGAVVGDNPAYDASIMQVERFEEFGERVSKADAAIAAEAEVDRAWPAPLVGTITVGMDPEEAFSRFRIKGGWNMLLKGYRGNDHMLHIASAQINPKEGTVTMQVDEAARDLLTLKAVIERQREVRDPIRRMSPTGRASTITQDRLIPWDCESGAGILPYHSVQANLWSVRRIPAAEYGTVNSTIFTTDAAAKFSVAVFGMAVTPAILASHGNPLTDDGYWETFRDEPYEPEVSWGGITDGISDLAGYYPSKETTDGAVPTGRMIDKGSWSFVSTKPPWLWVAVLCDTTTKVQGQMQVAIDTTGA